MSKYNDWQQTKAQVESANTWLGNRNKIDSQDGKRYAKVKLQKIRLEYCGQSHAGANNYHECPELFQSYIALAFNEMRESIEDLAIKMLNDVNNERAISAKSEVEIMLLAINSIESEAD